ncbi:MAG: 50S ribosomal protein L30 [bacterium]|nr:50S ribosomal protein L30 [bacterium]
MEEARTGRLRVTQTGSPIGRPADQRQTLVGLGLGRMSRTRILEDTPAVRGMLTKVHHLVDWEEIGGDSDS